VLAALGGVLLPRIRRGHRRRAGRDGGGNRGAADVGAPSIGLNIVLPHEQAPNLYVTPELCFNFHYFAIRKMHFVMRAKAVVVFPGGFGTLDEFFETLTLIQTGRMERVPVILFGNGTLLARRSTSTTWPKQGTISPGDQDIIDYADTADEAWKIMPASVVPYSR
jgi:predicted Rossmann-fold nucleotide-binding protein